MADSGGVMGGSQGLPSSARVRRLGRARAAQPSGLSGGQLSLASACRRDRGGRRPEELTAGRPRAHVVSAEALAGIENASGWGPVTDMRCWLKASAGDD